MFFPKNVTLKQYTWSIIQPLLTSQFVYKTPENCIELKNLRLKIQTKKQKKIHYMYLWLFTRKVPYLQKFYPSWKNNSSHLVLKQKAKRHSLCVKVLPKNKFALLFEILMEMIAKQNNSERKIWTFHQRSVQILIFSAPLTKNTALLQMKNTYFPNIPLAFQFHFSKATAFQKLFFLRSLKILSSDSKISGLDY